MYVLFEFINEERGERQEKIYKEGTKSDKNENESLTRNEQKKSKTRKYRSNNTQ